MPGTEAVTAPEPLSTVSATSVALVVEMRLVTATFNITVRFSVNAVPGVPPVQFKKISPKGSVIPSARTGGFPEVVLQVRGDWGLAIPMEKTRNENRINTRLDIEHPFTTYVYYSALVIDVKRNLPAKS